ncbi:MAG: hypothetical protein M1421_07295, partial [Candidatus Eremiobacteraeota bacterium]|nr:hypothetical protein [Candidatus Eremiobacteraeota bacterium]
LRQKKDWDTALNWYERALEFSTSEKEIHEKIITCHIQRKDRNGYLEAVNRYRNAKDSPPIPYQTLSHKLIEPPKPATPKPATPKPEPTKPEPPKPATPKPEPTKPEPPKPEPTKKTKEIPLFSAIESAPSLKRSSDISDAEMTEADAEQWEKRGEKETASKSYAQAAYLWKQKGDNARAGLAYEKSYELSPNPEILTQLNELYSQGVKLKQSTIMEIYKKIYHMKI